MYITNNVVKVMKTLYTDCELAKLFDSPKLHFFTNL